ncbi:PHP domain-containing protein [Desulforhopalus singaporensis]|uniref:Polymerase/histidinol phosphatase N-terminal domain-containing protein n=1 Tax=Desulforhopalus singaporensis TaxID=91360 RepID=A0A1H0PDR1_9BACT|nr:PHP domain-containing protein [Desulforhopalus singaporensis]SDP02835.1 hypothetical protein SAMN05660330_01616 [Desulforhopalus singaporensis]
MSIDLHIHSTMSDGTMTPTEIVRLAASRGLKAIALTDHDTADGVEEAMNTGEKCGVEVISGIELSVKYKQQNIHLLGYFFDHTDQVFLEALTRLQQGRVERNKKIVKKLNDLGISVDLEELISTAGNGQMGRPHIARHLIQKGYVATMEQAFTELLGQHGRAYVSRFIYQFPEASGFIKNAGGLTVLAHPYNLVQQHVEVNRLLQELADLGLDGIEVYYPSHPRKFKKELRKIAAQRSLFVTGGSDYHGDIRPGTGLAGGRNITVPDSVLEAMKNQLDGMNV